jgi:hypothetical protein
MRKDEYIELVQELVSGAAITADQKKSFHPAVIEQYIDMAFKAMCNIYVQESETSRDFAWLDPMCKWYEIALEDNCGIKSGATPQGIVHLDLHRGIRYIGADRGMNQSFAPVSSGHATSIFNDLDVSFVDKSPSYYITGEEINVVNYFEPKCYAFALPKFSSLEHYDEVIFPKGNDRGVWGLITEKIFQNLQVPSEKYNDANPDRS